MILNGWESLSQEDIVKNIEFGKSLLRQRPDIFVFTPKNNYKTGSNKDPFEKFIIHKQPKFKSMDFGLNNLPIGFIETMNDFKSKSSIKEMQKILQKHPNRVDIKMQLMELQKQNKPKIGKRKKK